MFPLVRLNCVLSKFNGTPCSKLFVFQKENMDIVLVECGRVPCYFDVNCLRFFLIMLKLIKIDWKSMGSCKTVVLYEYLWRFRHKMKLYGRLFKFGGWALKEVAFSHKTSWISPKTFRLNFLVASNLSGHFYSTPRTKISSCVRLLPTPPSEAIFVRRETESPEGNQMNHSCGIEKSSKWLVKYRTLKMIIFDTVPDVSHVKFYFRTWRDEFPEENSKEVINNLTVDFVEDTAKSYLHCTNTASKMSIVLYKNSYEGILIRLEKIYATFAIVFNFYSSISTYRINQSL